MPNKELEPNLSTPNFKNSSASETLLIPPAAFIFTPFDIFSENLIQYPVWDAFHAVLEVKYNGFLPSYIKELVSSVNCSEISVSKYGLSRSVGLHST